MQLLFGTSICHMYLLRRVVSPHEYLYTNVYVGHLCGVECVSVVWKVCVHTCWTVHSGCGWLFGVLFKKHFASASFISLYISYIYINWKLHVIHVLKTTFSMSGCQDEPWKIRSFICRGEGRTLFRKTSCFPCALWELRQQTPHPSLLMANVHLWEMLASDVKIPVGYAIWSYLTFKYIAIFSYSFTCLVSICWGLLKALSKECMVQSSVLVGCCITQALRQTPRPVATATVSRETSTHRGRAEWKTCSGPWATLQENPYYF